MAWVSVRCTSSRERWRRIDIISDRAHKLRWCRAAGVVGIILVEPIRRLNVAKTKAKKSKKAKRGAPARKKKGLKTATPAKKRTVAKKPAPKPAPAPIVPITPPPVPTPVSPMGSFGGKTEGQ